jgi:RES domain-containing protein
VHDDAAITATLQEVSPSPFRSYAYRVIDDEYRTDPLSGLGSVLKGGRCNAPHSFEALYASDSRLTALHEVAAIFGDVDQPRSPELILTLDVRLTRVLDLTDQTVRNTLGTTEDELMVPFLEDQLRLGEAPTQRLGRLVFGSHRFSGVRAPSAARIGSCNIVIFPARFAADELLRLHDDRGRWRQIRVVERVIAGESISELSRMLGYARQTLHRWFSAYEVGGKEALVSTKASGAVAKLAVGSPMIHRLGSRHAKAGLGYLLDPWC